MKISSIWMLGTALALGACGAPKEKSEESVPPAIATDTVSATSDTTPASSAGPDAKHEQPLFDLGKVAVSAAQLPAFPYVTLPSGYSIRDEKTMDLAAYPFWTGRAFQIIEGKVYMARSGTPEGKTYSRLEFERGIENSVKAAGGVQVTRSEAPNDTIEDLPSSLRQDMGLGLGPIYGNPITTYVIRRADRTIWVQVVSDSDHSTWAVVDAPLT